MEFFIPGLATLLIAALVVFLVLPRLGAPVLVALSIVLLVYGVYNHASIFAPEYRYSTWQEQLKLYAPFVIIAVALVGILLYLGLLFTSKGESALPAPNIAPAPELPPANTATNPLTAALNNVIQTANQVANQVSNVVNSNKKNNSGAFSLNSLIKTPNNVRA